MIRTSLLRGSLGMAAVLLAAALPRPGLAQTDLQDCSTSPINVTLIRIGDETIDTGANTRVPNAQECADREELRFRVLEFPTANNLLVYASDLGINCQDSAVRMSQDTRDDCKFIKQDELVNASQREFTVSLEEGVTCTTDGVSTKKIYFFPSSSTETGETFTNFGCYQLEVDARPPAAPTGLNNPRGERLLKVEWEPLGDNTVIEYYVFYDYGVNAADAGMRDAGGTPVDIDAGGDDLTDGGVASTPGEPNPDCPSSVLIEGAVLDINNLPDGIAYERKTGMAANSAELNAELLGGLVTPVAVAAVDQARNVGPLSEVVCAEVVDTIGFWEQYKNNGGAAQGGCACSAGPTAGAAGATPVGLVLLGLWLRARRRRA